MLDEESAARQRAKDEEYRRACAAAGITPMMPSYIGNALAGIDDMDVALDSIALRQGLLPGVPHNLTEEEPPGAAETRATRLEAAEGVLRIIMPTRAVTAKMYVRIAGARALALAWLLGKVDKSLAELAREMGVSRAALSAHARAIEDRTGLHGRGQKSVTAAQTYVETAKAGHRTRLVNKLLREAVEPSP